MKQDLEEFINRKIVLDTRSSWMYMGILERVTGQSAVLTEADVHDSSDSRTTKELYVLESKETGIKSNRDRVFVNLDYIVSFSVLDDVKNF